MIYNKQVLKNLFERDLLRIESELKTESKADKIMQLYELSKMSIKTIEKLNQI